jgi:hypothetical protein
MYRRGSWFAGVLVFSLVPLAIAGVKIQPSASPRPALRMSTLPGQMFRDLQDLSLEKSLSHTAHWKHTESHGGEGITAMSVAPTTLDAKLISIEPVRAGQSAQRRAA